MASQAYGFIDVVASIVGPGGAFQLGAGSAVADEGITVEMEEDKGTLTIGADGTPMYSMHAGNAGTVTVRLQKTSPVNAQLMAMYDLQRVSTGLFGINVITISQKASNDKISAVACGFRRAPNITYAKEGGMMEWSWFAGSINTLLGTY